MISRSITTTTSMAPFVRNTHLKSLASISFVLHQKLDHPQLQRLRLPEESAEEDEDGGSDDDLQGDHPVDCEFSLLVGCGRLDLRGGLDKGTPDEIEQKAEVEHAELGVQQHDLRLEATLIQIHTLSSG